MVNGYVYYNFFFSLFPINLNICINKINHKEVILMNKKGIVTHPVTLFLAGVVIGAVLIILVCKDIIKINLGFC